MVNIERQKKYTDYKNNLGKLRYAIYKENIEKFRYGYQWDFVYTEHFVDIAMERDIPLKFIQNVSRYLMEFHRFDFRNYGQHHYNVNGFTFVLKSELKNLDIVTITFLTVLSDNHKTSSYSDMISITLKHLMDFDERR